MDPAGQYLYVANVKSKLISVLSIAASSGALTPVAGSPFFINLVPDQYADLALGSFSST